MDPVGQKCESGIKLNARASTLDGSSHVERPLAASPSNIAVHVHADVVIVGAGAAGIGYALMLTTRKFGIEHKTGPRPGTRRKCRSLLSAMAGRCVLLGGERDF